MPTAITAKVVGMRALAKQFKQLAEQYQERRARANDGNTKTVIGRHSNIFGKRKVA